VSFRSALRTRSTRGPAIAGDSGAGVFSMAMGLLVFFAMLLFATHLMLYLHLNAVASDAALAGAHVLATQPAGSHRQGAADTQAGHLLGRAFDHSTIGPSDGTAADDAGYVTYNVTTKRMSLSAPQWAGPWANQPITRSARVRIEEPR
jgi:hypothetical protein